MELALKQRVVGASVLVVLAVIFVPMVLDGPATDSVLIMDLEIPQSGQETQSRVLPLDLGEQPGQPSRPPVDLVDPSVAPVDDAIEPVLPTLPRDESDASTQTPEPVAVEPLTEPDPVPAVVSGDWSFQVGSFSDEQRANRLIEALSAEGFPAFSVRASINGATRTRVRVGPFVSSERAEQAAGQVRQAFPELSTTLLSGDQPGGAAVQDTTESTTALAAPAWAIQLGSFGDKSNAETLVSRLKDEGFAAWTEQVSADSGTAWRVRVGPHLKREDATRQRDLIERSLSIRGLVVSHP